MKKEVDLESMFGLNSCLIDDENGDPSVTMMRRWEGAWLRLISLKTDEPSKKMKCISVPVVADKICRDLFPMYWSDGMVCAGQVDKNKNCLVRAQAHDLISSASTSDLLYMWIESVVFSSSRATAAVWWCATGSCKASIGTITGAKAHPIPARTQKYASTPAGSRT